MESGERQLDAVPVAPGFKAGGAEENQGGEKRRLPKLKNPVKVWRNRRQQNHNHTAEDEHDGEEAQQEEQLEEVSRRLILREEQLFSQDSPTEEEEDQLHRDYEALRLQIWMAIHNTFSSSSSSSSSGHLAVLRSAVASIQQQEEQDRRWLDRQQGQVPVWRPQKCWSTHHNLLQSMVESRLTKSAEEEAGGADGLSTPLKREVCWMGWRVKEDLLAVARTVKDCYPPQVDILNLYAGLYHQRFSGRLTELAAAGLEPDDRSYLLFWINHCYPHEILKHEDLEGNIKTACLGSLLLLDHLDHLEDQYLTHKEDQVKLWLSAVLRKEEENWLSDRTPELIEQHHFSPLAVDVIQVIDGALIEFRCVIRDQSKAQRITAHLDSFLSSYKKCLEDFVKGNHGNVHSVIKAHLFCEQQLRGYITDQTGSVSEQQRRDCLDTLSALRDCGYRCFTCPIHNQLKVFLSQLWTPVWLDGSLPVVDSLLDSLSQHLDDLTDLEPACRQALLCVLHEHVVCQYVRMMMTTKMRMKNREQQVGGAQRMTEDSRKMADFFIERGCTESGWLAEVVDRLAEILRLQDPGSVQLELVSLSRRFHDLSDGHVSALLSLKTGLSATDMRSIRRSVKENRLPDVSTNQSPLFFSKVKMTRINQLVLKAQALSAR